MPEREQVSGRRSCSETTVVAGIAETLDWTAALLRLGISTIDKDGAERILDTLSALIKTREDRAAFPREAVARLAAAC